MVMSKPSHMIGHNVTSSRPQRSRLGDCLDSALGFFSIAQLQYMPVYGQLSGGSAVVLSHSISFQHSAAILKRKNNARHAPCAVTQAVTSLPAGLSGLCERFEQVPFLVPFLSEVPCSLKPTLCSISRFVKRITVYRAKAVRAESSGSWCQMLAKRGEQFIRHVYILRHEAMRSSIP